MSLTALPRRNIIKEKTAVETVEKTIGYVIRLAFFIIIFDALLLLSAVAEHGETEMSARLVPHIYEVPEMIEALVAALTVSVAGGAAASYMENK